ncbi:MAG: ribonuclease P protein component [Verrucomicrobiae bacterium]|nr:ribonuclease P protein component [Verrucomicrobiae bacterium]
MRFRFTARQHLRSTREFDTVRKFGRAFQSAPFVFTLFQPDRADGDKPIRRLGVVASRRVGKAVVRNRCKRQCRELFRLHQHELPEHCDCVFLVRRKFPEMSYAELEQKFLQACDYVTRKK